MPTDSPFDAPLEDAYDEFDLSDSYMSELVHDVSDAAEPRRPSGGDPSELGDGDVSIDSEPLPEDLPALADNTNADLSSLFDNSTAKHLTDGFTGSGDEDGENISQNDGDDIPDPPEHPAGA